MINYDRIYKDIEDNLIYGTGFVHMLTYADTLPFCYYKITASEETLDFSYEANGYETIKVSIPYEIFWEPNDIKEIVADVMEMIIKIGRKGNE